MSQPKCFSVMVGQAMAQPYHGIHSAKLKQVGILILIKDIPSGPAVESLPFNAGDGGSVPG